VSAFIDTNVLVRHLTGDPPAMAARATAYLRSESELFLADLIVAETVYVLESFYEVPRAQVAEVIRSLLAFGSIVVLDRDVLLRAVEVYEVDRLDFAEACVTNIEGSPDEVAGTVGDGAVQEMKEGPSESPCAGRLQTASRCVG
jgi:predicted nucleic-acid-binding protein